MSRLKYLIFGLAIAIAGGVGAQNVYNYFYPGGALSGNATVQSVNLAAGSSYILNALPIANETAAGSNNYIQYNNGGLFTGDADLSWLAASNDLLVGNNSSSDNGIITVGGFSTGTGLVASGGGQLTVRGQPLLLTSLGGNAINIAGSAGSGTATGSTISVTAGNAGTSSSSPGGAVTLTGGQGNATAHSGNVSLVGGPGYSTTGTGGNVVLQGGLGSTTAQSGTLNFLTNNSNRFEIDNYGAWLLGGSAGTAGQVLTTHAGGQPPTWTSVAGFNTATSYTVTGNWTFDPTSGSAITINGAPSAAVLTATSASGTGLVINLFDGSESNHNWSIGASVSESGYFQIYDSTRGATDLSISQADGGIITNGQTDEGAGTINAAALYQSGVPIPLTSAVICGLTGGGSGTALNVSACTNTATGTYTISFIVSYATALTCTGSISPGGAGVGFVIPSSTGGAATSVTVHTYNSAGTATNEPFSLVCTGVED